MKIKRISDYSMAVCFTFACSQCEVDVDGGDRFCYNCGHKLSTLPNKIMMQKAADILTDALRKEPVDPAKTDEADDSEIDSDLTDWSAVAGLGKPHCMCGHHDPATCGHLLKSGACDARICTSNPPQYQICPFRGNGFIPVTEA